MPEYRLPDQHQAIMGLVRAPHRYAPNGGKYDVELLAEKRDGVLTKIEMMLIWDSTRW